jgi:hypothetical protein
MRPLSILAGVLILCGLAAARDREFDTIVRSVEARCDTSHTRIPFFGFANFLVKVVRPAGASDLKLAVFEDIRRPIFAQEEDFTSLMQGALGPDWRPFVRVQDRRNNEWTCIYASTSANRWKLLIASMEKREAAIIRIKLNPEGMMKWIAKPCQETRTWRRD